MLTMKQKSGYEMINAKRNQNRINNMMRSKKYEENVLNDIFEENKITKKGENKFRLITQNVNRRKYVKTSFNSQLH